MSADTKCGLCNWSGEHADLIVHPANHELLACPRCRWASGLTTPGGSAALVRTGPLAATAVPPPSILDAAISASSALDPLGSRKPDDHLRVPTFDELEAERRRVAERIASMGRGA